MSVQPPSRHAPATELEEHGVNPWDRFLAARTSDVFCTAWLTLVCEKLPSVRQAAVLIEADGGQTFVPIAVWPTASTDMARMGAAVEQALGERRIVVLPRTEQPGLHYVAVPVSANDRIAGAVVLETAADGAALQLLLRELHWGSAWLTHLFGKREFDAALEARDRAMGILETIATTLRHARFQQALFELCNGLRQRFDCSRVAIGVVREAHVKLAALSEAATFEKSSPMVQAYTNAMAEACDLARVIEVSHPAAGAVPDTYRAHAALRRRVGAESLISLPVNHREQVIAVITLERDKGHAFSESERKWLETLAALFAPVAAQRCDAERNSLQRLRDEGRRFCAGLLGPRHLSWKAGGLLALLATAVLIWLPVPYRVSAKTVTEGEIQRVAAAPFEGYLAAGFVRAGDTVARGQVLAQLDDHDLRMDQTKWTSERDQYDNKLREAMAEHDLTAIRVVGAQLDEAQAQLDLANDKLARTRILAPYDGVVVSGDLSQQIGTPVEAGKKLFDIAPLHSYRIILQVDERDIRQVRDSQFGLLEMSGLAGDPMPFTVAKIMPVATTQDGKNFYRVEAQLRQASPLLLPGMEGVGKIDVGRRKLGWVMLHGLLDWARLKFWEWEP